MQCRVFTGGLVILECCRPCGVDVVVRLVCMHPVGGSMNSSAGPTTVSVVFTPTTWRTAQVVTFRGVDDFIDDGDQPCRVTVLALASEDPVYAALLVQSSSSSSSSSTDQGQDSAESGDTLYVIWLARLLLCASSLVC